MSPLLAGTRPHAHRPPARWSMATEALEVRVMHTYAFSILLSQLRQRRGRGKAVQSAPYHPLYGKASSGPHRGIDGNGIVKTERVRVPYRPRRLRIQR